MLELLLIALLSGRMRASLPPQPVTDWKVDLSTSGGFTGAGSGNFVVTSDGMFVTSVGPDKQCPFHLTPEEVRAIDDAIRNSRPTVWSECHTLADQRTHCCDLIRTSMTLSERGGRDVYVTSWITGS